MNRRDLLTTNLATWTLAFLLTAAAGTAEARELHGTVSSLEDGQHVPRGGLSLALDGTTATARTDDEGRFRLALPSAAGPGDTVHLRLADAGWYVDQPWDGAVRVPGDPDEGVEILVTDATPDGLWDAERLGAFLADYLTTSAAVAGWRDPPNFSWEMDQWCHRHGVAQEEDHFGRVDAWIAAARAGEDPRHKGYADFLEAKFADAARHLGTVADARLAELAAAGGDAPAETRRQAVRALELKAAALYRAEDDAAAAGALRQALGLLPAGEAPGLRTDLSYRLGLVLHDQGRRGGEAAAAQLSEAVATFREVLEARKQDEVPDAWAAARVALAAALADSGDLDAAVKVYEETLAARPDENLAAHDLVKLYHNRLDDTSTAFQKMGGWLNAHPSDAIGRIILVELFFAQGRWDVCLTMSGVLADATRVPGLEHYAITMRLYQAAALLALEDPSEARAVVDELLAELDALPAGFHFEWELDGTLRVVRGMTDLAHKEWIVALFEAGATGERDQIVAGLAELAAKLPPPPPAEAVE